ncbi:MAG: class I SAM-dependent methyltransferase [Oscillospiraceae bacterium]|nr:class I SAM-dependent methyltransferase [Oscillospiraceae bacterium]
MYTYPDKNDMLTIQLIMGVSEGNYWGESENEILKVALDTVKSYDNPKMLDCGCGQGRLFPIFAPHVQSIYALEPDTQRYSIAVDSAAALSEYDIAVKNNDSSSLNRDQEFDIVLSSHVLQHIPESVADSMIADIAAHTAPGGCIIVTTTHTDRAEDILTMEYFKDGKRVCDEVDEETFKESFSKEGVLPVRLFADGSVPKLFAKHGFDKVSAKRYFHYYVPGETQTARTDIEKNAQGDDKGARDILFIFRRSADVEGDNVRMDACISFQYSFSLSDFPQKAPFNDKYYLLHTKLATAFPGSIAQNDPEAVSDPVFRDLTTAQNFLHGGGTPFDCLRFLIKGFYLKFVETEMYETAILLTFFPEFNTATLMFCFEVNDATTDELVYYRQIFSGAAKFRSKDGEENCLWDWFHKIIKPLGKVSDIDQTYFMELKAMHPYTDLNEVIEKESRRLYGIICGDEGWEYVPEELARYRIDNQWGSRNFVRFIVFGSNAMLLNFNRLKPGMDYVEHQRAFGEAVYGGANPYFLMNSNVAGINHGIIFSQETVFVIKTIANRVLNRQSGFASFTSNKLGAEISKTKKFRSELITILNRVENLGITEIGELEQMLLRSYKITPLIDSIKYLLELLESELDLLYQQSTNRLVNILTIAGLILSVIDVLSGLGLI